MNRKVIGAVLGIIAVAVIAGLLVFALRQTAPQENLETTNGKTPQQQASPDSSRTSSSDSAVSSGDVAEEGKIEIENYAFQPEIITVKRGATVTWTNKDDIQHDVVADDDTQDGPQSELLSKGESYRFTFDEVGEFTYHCSPHPYMKGTVKVIE